MCLCIHGILLYGYSRAGVSTAGRAAKRVRPVLDSSLEEESESVVQASSRTGEMSLSVQVNSG